MLFRKSIVWLCGASLVICAPALSIGQQTGNTIRISNAEVRLLHEAVEVAAQADGIIRQIHVEEGREVSEGSEAVSIDARVAMAEVAVAKTELEAAQKQFEQTAEIDYAKATLAVAREEYADMLRLDKMRAVSTTQVRKAELEKTRGELGVDAQLVKKLQDEMAVRVAEQKLHAAEVRAEMFDMKVPMQGIVTERIRDRGEWVRAGEPVFKMVNLNELKVAAMVPVYKPNVADPTPQPYEARERTPRQTATVSPSELKDALMKITIQVSPTLVHTVEANVSFVSPTLRLNEVLVWAKIPNQRLSPGGPWLLRDGMIADVQIILP